MEKMENMGEMEARGRQAQKEEQNMRQKALWIMEQIKREQRWTLTEKLSIELWNNSTWEEK